MTEIKDAGIIVLNKEAGISSNTAVNRVKHLVNAQKAGHLGTLDVLGEGVLPITLNKATRLFDYYLTKDKTYRAIFVFGFQTTTLDCEGEVDGINFKEISPPEIQKVLSKFKGKIKQVPPLYSSIKIGGKSAYKHARKGEQLELKSREIEIYDFKLLGEVKQQEKQLLIDRFLKFHNMEILQSKEISDSFKTNVFEFEISCSAGTYIRSLCRDLAHQLSTYGTMLSIIRTRCGNFRIEESSNLNDIKNGKFTLIDVEKAIDLPCIFINEREGKDILDGKKVKIDTIQETSFKLYSNNVFFGIANNKNDGIIKIETFLKE